MRSKTRRAEGRFASELDRRSSPPFAPSDRPAPMSDLSATAKAAANGLPARPSDQASAGSLRGTKLGPERRCGGATPTAAAAALGGTRDDGGSGRAFFPVPEADSGDGPKAELSEAEMYLLSVRCVLSVCCCTRGPSLTFAAPLDHDRRRPGSSMPPSRHLRRSSTLTLGP